MKKIETKNAPAAIGPYSQGFVSGGFVFASGQIPIDPSLGAMVPGGIEEQARQSCKNAAAVLEAGGSSLEKVVKTTCFLADMADFPAFNRVYEEFFTGKPARSCVAVKALPKGALCEIEAIAEL
jgi:2-iminobutanoate/2-iminopropanoate deaminase